MMREIKFRAWDTRNKEMLEVTDIAWELNDHGIGAVQDVSVFMPYEFGPIRRNIVKWFELMQFTGLHDKNGKEIYEGDIIHEYVEADVDGKVEVATDEKFAVEWYCQDLDCGWTLFPVSCDGYEVIGNIYENTELLKETA